MKIEVYTDYTDQIYQRHKELLPFLLEKRAPGHEAFIIYVKLVVSGVSVLGGCEGREEGGRGSRRGRSADRTLECSEPFTEILHLYNVDEQFEEAEDLLYLKTSVRMCL